MAKKYGVRTTAITSLKWTNKYRKYRAVRTRLYLCMVLFMLFVLLLAVSAAFLLKNSFYLHPNEYELNKEDMRAAEVSTMLCEGLALKESGFNRRIMVISPAKRRQATNSSMLTDVVFLRRDRHWYRSFYLLKGSIVKMRLQSSHSITVYWMKGRTILEEWAKRMDRVLKQSFAVRTSQYTGTTMDDTFEVYEDSNYYFGITSVAGDTNYSKVFINFTISRVVYDTRSYIAFCNASAGESCQVKLRFLSDDTAVIEVPGEDAAEMLAHDVWTAWYCQPRIWIYLAIFGGILLLALLVLFFVYMCVMVRVNKKLGKQKPSQIPSRTESFDMRAVKLQSINATEEPSVDPDGASNLAPLRLSSAITHNISSDTEEGQSVEPKTDVNGCITTNALVNSNDQVDQNANSQLWSSTPSPRWSTFLQSPACEYEECVTDFHEPTTDTGHSIREPNIYDEEEETYFGNELVDRLEKLQETDNIPTWNDPEETDIDDVMDNSCADSEFEPFIGKSDDDGEDVAAARPSDEDYVEVMRRRRERRRESRWHPRLSMVTEV